MDSAWRQAERRNFTDSILRSGGQKERVTLDLSSTDTGARFWAYRAISSCFLQCLTSYRLFLNSRSTLPLC